MKYKIPTDVFVHPHTGEQLRYDPRTSAFDTASDVAPVAIQTIGDTTRNGKIARLKRWARQITRSI